jgi:cytochrome-b5 reductase
MSEADIGSELLATPLHGIYIPATLLAVGIAILSPSHTLHGVLASVILVILKLARGYTRKPPEYDVELVNKIPLNHNTTMYVSVYKREFLTSTNCRYRFALPRETDLLRFEPGQCISISAKSPTGTVSRCYNPISDPDCPGLIEVLVKHYPEGTISRYLNEIGLHRSVRISGPLGRPFASSLPNLGMLAGGTGITPMLQIIGAIVRNPADMTVVSLVFANVTEHDILLKENLDELAAKYPNFYVHYVVERPSPQWTGGMGYITNDIVERQLGPCGQLLICGPQGFIDCARRIVGELGYGDDSVVVFQ